MARHAITYLSGDVEEVDAAWYATVGDFVDFYSGKKSDEIGPAEIVLRIRAVDVDSIRKMD